MKFYYVSTVPVEYKNDKGELIEVSKDAIYASTVEKGKTPLKFNGEDKGSVKVFASEEVANEFAAYAQDADDKAQYAVLTLDSKIESTDGLKKPKRRLHIENEDKTKKYLEVFEVAAKHFTLLNASFKYADEKAQDISFVDAPAKSKEVTAETSSSFVNGLKRIAAPVVTAATVGTGFWYAGGVPAAVAALAKLGLALPAASLATQIAIPAVVGLATYAAGLAAWTIGKAVVNGVSSAWKKFNRTNKEKYTDDLNAEVEAIKSLEKQLELKEDSSFVVRLDKLLSDAPEAQFDEKGVFAKDEPKKEGDKLALAQWEHKQLEAVKAAKAEDRQKLMDEMRNGPKPAPKP